VAPSPAEAARPHAAAREPDAAGGTLRKVDDRHVGTLGKGCRVGSGPAKRLAGRRNAVGWRAVIGACPPVGTEPGGDLGARTASPPSGARVPEGYRGYSGYVRALRARECILFPPRGSANILRISSRKTPRYTLDTP
jgi:hypothetical protein